MGWGRRAFLHEGRGAVSAFLINQMIITDRLPIVNTAGDGSVSARGTWGIGAGKCENPPADFSAGGQGSGPMSAVRRPLHQQVTSS